MELSQRRHSRLGLTVSSTKQNVLGILVDAVDYDGAVERIIEAAEARKPLSVSALAVHGVMTGVLDSSHRHRLNHLDLVVPDGQPVRYALNWLHGSGLRDRVSGPILMLKLCGVAAERGLPIFLYGSRPDVLAALCTRLRERFPALIIAGAEPSKFRPLSAGEKAETVERIRSSGAQITFVGLGCPRQEVWAYEYRDVLPTPILAVGAAFDFHAGYLVSAPMPMQNAGLEWLYRLWQEPRRLWRRYLYLNPLFVGHLTLQLTRLKRYDPGDTTVPARELGYG
jgi:N-acetylglucosaminyldiphosphoundecaprenol N-acetyl-beta-D-mannosaminyltransferase